MRKKIQLIVKAWNLIFKNFWRNRKKNTNIQNLLHIKENKLFQNDFSKLDF